MFSIGTSCDGTHRVEGHGTADELRSAFVKFPTLCKAIEVLRCIHNKQNCAPRALSMDHSMPHDATKEYVPVCDTAAYASRPAAARCLRAWLTAPDGSAVVA